MARRLRVVYPGAIYHLTVRGNARQTIFRDERDRERWLAQLREQVAQHGVRLYLYGLMTNHVHLVVETPQANVSRFMQGLTTAYAMYFNKRHRRVGHLLQGRFGARLVDSDEHLLKLSRYVHLNPVQVGEMPERPVSERVRYLRGYRWSSYPAYLGQTKGLEGLEPGPVLAQLPGRKAQRRLTYRKYVESGLAETDEEFAELMTGVAEGIGGSEFLAKIRELAEGQLRRLRRPEDTTFRRVSLTVAPAMILQAVSHVMNVPVAALRRRRRGDMGRGVAALMLGRHGGLSQREVAGELGVRWGSAISWQARRTERLARCDRDLQRQLRAIEQMLKGPG